MIEELREKIKDYYITVSHFYIGALGDYEDVDNMNDEEVIEEARKLHLI